MDFIKKESNYQKIQQYRLDEYKRMIEALSWEGQAYFGEEAADPHFEYQLNQEVAREFDVQAHVKNEAYYRQILN